MRYLLSLLIPLTVIAAMVAASRSYARWEPLHRVEQWLFAVARPLHTERRIALSADISALGSSTLVAIIAAIVAIGLVLDNQLRDAIVLVTAVALAGASGTGLKRITRRARPEGATGAMFGSSFPSSHTLMGTTLWLTVGAIASEPASGGVHAWIWVAAVLLAVAIGLSRVFLHIHYLSDVMAGWAVGAAFAVAGMLWRVS